MKVILIIGTRPHFIKCAPLIRELKEHSDIELVIIHTGQHYDHNLSHVFSKDLNFPEIKYNLNVGSETHGIQTGKMLERLDAVLLKEKPCVVVVMGDTNTTLAGALAAYKLHIPLGHIEAGMREYIWRPEEINKVVADHCADFCFCSTETGVKNCLKENINHQRIFFVGDLTYDAFLTNIETAKSSTICADLGLTNHKYALVTVHRAETVDNFKRIKDITDALLNLNMNIICPIHPRTKKALETFGLLKKIIDSKHIKVIPPVGPFDFLALLCNANLVLTDSSGVLKEAFYAHKPCVTLDNTSEYMEIFNAGRNILAGYKKQNILCATKIMLAQKLMTPKKQIFGDGTAAKKIVTILKRKIK